MFEARPASKTVSRSSDTPDAFARVMWRLPVLGIRVVKHVLWKAEGKWKARGWRLPFGGEKDTEYVVRGMMWADNCWLLCDNKESGMHGNDITEELLDLDMEPKPESLWWTTRGHDNTSSGKQIRVPRMATAYGAKTQKRVAIVQFCEGSVRLVITLRAVTRTTPRHTPPHHTPQPQQPTNQPAAQCAPTQENSPGPDTARIDRWLSLDSVVLHGRFQLVE